MELDQGAGVSLWIPVIVTAITGLFGGGFFGSWLTARAEFRKTESDHAIRMLEAYSSQMQKLSERVAVLEEDRRSIVHSRDQAHRIAHRALDREDDWQNYFQRRDMARSQNDPDGALTSWVPGRPNHLDDDGWGDRRRAELLALDDDEEDEPPRIRDPT